MPEIGAPLRAPGLERRQDVYLTTPDELRLTER